MSTFSSTNIVKRDIFTKPYLITTDDLEQIGESVNLVGYDPLRGDTFVDESIVNFRFGNPSSPRILNWVEPYEIGGFRKTLFYTEVNSGLKVGDKVFIINGAYDSNLLIEEDKYKRSRDGYKVLFIDRCRVVLDIDYVGWLPANETSPNQELFDDFIKVYYINDRNDFIHVNRQITTNNGVTSKFGPSQNNVIYIDNSYSAVGNIGDWGYSTSVVGPGFFFKDGNSWTKIINFGTYSTVQSNSNSKVLILNGSFTTVDNQFNEDSVYKWVYDSVSESYNWIVDVKHENNNPPILTKSNFRDGVFNGKWNGGLYGTNDKRIEWNSPTAKWNSGTLLNTVWKVGIMDSLYTQSESYFAEFDTSGLPHQKVTNPDNNGYGYNFIINSDIQNAVINNGNVSNSNLGLGAGSYSVVEEHIRNGSVNLDNFTTDGLVVNKALFDNCKFINANIENTEIRNSRAINSRFNKVKSVNSHYKSSLFLNSNYISDNIIKVLDFQETNYSQNNTTVTHKVYKFYINKRSYERFKLKDNFYIRGLKINDGTKTLNNFFDKKFKIGIWTEFSNGSDSNGFYKRGVEYSAFVSTPRENKFKFAVNTGINTTFDIDERGYSLDIFVSIKDIDGFDIPNINYSNIIDFSDAYIVNSDFESGLFENSNWNGGAHINYSNDVNITIPGYKGGTYNLSIDSINNKMTAVVGPTTRVGSEVEDDYLSPNNIVFLNAVDYDTRGKVSGLSIINGGSGYTTSLLETTSSNGTGLKLDITASVIGSVISVTYSTNINYNQGTYTTSQGSGTGLLVFVDVVNVTEPSPITSIVVSSPGSGYLVGDVVSVDGGLGSLQLIVSNITNGEITSVSISDEGLGYLVGDVISVDGGSATLEVTSITGSITRLPDAYKILSYTNVANNTSIIEMEPVESTNILSTLLDGGIFNTEGANNRYGYIHKTKFNKSRIVSGMFKRSYIKNSLIKNDSYDITDRDFNNIPKLKSLILLDTIFSSNNNILSNATYMNSFFVGGNDIWENGILYNSIWNGMNFRNGLLKESTWIDGTFTNGLFYNSRSFNNSTEYDYNQNSIKSYYKSGIGLNNRYSWQRGVFNNGEFYKGDWESGTFNNGKFYYSKFYSGTFNNGIIGDKSVPVTNTVLYNGTVNFSTVYNSTIVANKFRGISSSEITWNDGIFNSGVFGTNTTIPTNTATWYSGVFNGGDFVTNGKWKNGIFNGGRFTSSYGWLQSSSTNKIDYGWEDGIFNGGKFGNGSIGENSTWFKGEFNGGQFKGRVWNDGIFTFGEFLGSGEVAFGGLTSSNANSFVEPFISSTDGYYGLWRNGCVSDLRDKFISDRKIFTDIKRASDTTRPSNRAVLKNILWENGIFSHSDGEIINSVWLNGTFEKGSFNNGSFNPYVKRDIGNPRFNLSDTCYWKNGTFNGGEFYISKWENGRFISGTATGMIWKNGTVDYMNAYNIFWEDGLWRNGNWNGSYYNIDFDGSVTDDYILQIIDRGIKYTGTSSCHVWNVFYKEPLSSIGIGGTILANTVIRVPSGISDNPPTPPTTFTATII